MAKYAPVYMTVYDGHSYALAALSLSSATFVADAVEDTAIGTISGVTDATDSSLSIVSPLDDTVKLSGNDLVVGATPSDAGTFDVIIRETNIYGSNSPRDTTFEITVSA